MKNNNTYIGYSDSHIYYVAKGITKKRFLELVQAHYPKGHISKNWVQQRMSNGANENVSKKLDSNPNCFLILNDDYEIIKKVPV